MAAGLANAAQPFDFGARFLRRPAGYFDVVEETAYQRLAADQSIAADKRLRLGQILHGADVIIVEAEFFRDRADDVIEGGHTG